MNEATQGLLTLLALICLVPIGLGALLALWIRGKR